MRHNFLREKLFCQLTLLAALILLLAAGSLAQQRAPVDRFSVRWQNLPLVDAVERLRSVTGAPIFLDRRVDPNRRISLTASNADIDEVLTNLASSAGLGHTQLGRLHYLGPQPAADGLADLAALRWREVEVLNATARSYLSGRRRLAWPRLTEPRGLITQLVTEHDWAIGNPARIPHDLWAAGELPAMPLADQLTVLLAGFDLTYRIEPEERIVTLLPVEWQEVPRGKAARRPARRSRPSSAAPARQVFTLRVENQPVGRVLEQLAQRLGLKLDVDEAAIRVAGLSLERLVSFQVENADQQELLEALLAPAGLSAHAVGDRLRIAPK